MSVVIPCFNQGVYVNEALASVYAQTLPDWEVVIVDDGSTDDTARILARIDHPSVRVVAQINRGLPEARNRGVRESKGEFLLPLDADDRIRPRMMELCVRILERRSRLGFVYPSYSTFGAEHRIVRSPPYNFYRLLQVNEVPVCALVRRRAWEEVGGYGFDMHPGAADWEFWIRCGERGWHGRRIRRVLFEYRVRPGSMWSETRTEMDEVLARLREAHPDLYSAEGNAAVQREWCRMLDVHNPESIFARSCGALPRPVREWLRRGYARWLR